MINYNFLKTLNILYIQNDEDIKENFLKMVDGLFDNIICTNSADVDNFDIKIIDIVISDFDILKEIREKDSLIPILIISNNIEENKLLEAINYKVSDYLPQDVDIDSLIDSIQRISKTKHHDTFITDMQEDLEELISAINDVALVSKSDLQGNITFANKYFCETSGYTQEELLGQNHSLIRAKDSNDEQIKNLKNAIKLGIVWEGKMKYISKTNDIFFGYLTIIPILNPLDNSLKEYMWIRFLSTQEEVEQNEFKRKVAQNIHFSRRINLEARAQIDVLFKQLDKCKTIDFIKFSLLDEKNRTSKFVNQISFYEKELKIKEEQIQALSQKATVKIKGIIETEKKARTKKDDAINTMTSLKDELDLRNKDINKLTEELDTQIELIEELKNKIIKKEKKLGLV